MAFDWLFGQPVVQVAPDCLQLRSLVMDQDTVRDVVALVSKRTGDAGLYYVGPLEEGGGTPVAFDLARLDTAADWEIRRLIIRGGPNHGAFSVDLRFGVQPTIIFQDQYRELAREVANVLLAEGTAQPQWKPLIPRLPLVGVLAAIACWVWFLVGQRPPLSLGITGSLIIALSAVTAWDIQLRLQQRVGRGFPGHRIRAMSRQEVRSLRADRYADLKVAAITLPVGALLAAAALWLFGVY